MDGQEMEWWSRRDWTDTGRRHVASCCDSGTEISGSVNCG